MGRKQGPGDFDPAKVVWSNPRTIEGDQGKGFGYISVDVIEDRVRPTYYDWSRAPQFLYVPFASPGSTSRLVRT